MAHSALPFVECDQVHAGLAVNDIATAVEFYTKKLGFVAAFTWGDPPTFAGVKLDNAQIFLRKGTPDPKGCFVSFTVGDADALYEFHRSKGVEVVELIDDRPYGIRDYGVRDLHGYHLSFGHTLLNSGPPIKIERVDVPVRLEKRLAALLFGHIDACDQQQQSGPAEQRQQYRAHLAHDDFREWNDTRPFVVVGRRILQLQLLRDGIHFPQRHLRGDASVQPPHAPKVVKGPLLLVKAQHIQGNPEFSVAGPRKVERTWQDANKRVDLSVEVHGLPNQIATSPETTEPCAITHERDVGPADPVLGRIEVTPEYRTHAEGLKEAAAHALRRDRFCSGRSA